MERVRGDESYNPISLAGTLNFGSNGMATPHVFRVSFPREAVKTSPMIDTSGSTFKHHSVHDVAPTGFRRAFWIWRYVVGVG